jgi:acetylornithine deacetylase/succinyl-diaminopimelate desuccinylase-like protein
MGPVENAVSYAREHAPDFLDDLREFVRFPSVSAQPAHGGDVRACAAWLAEHLTQAGLERSQVVGTAGHPLVYAEWRHAPGQPTLLVYGHYDVQPAEPMGNWKSPPFKPTVRGSYLYGRGASDDKGQLLVHIKAIESWLRTQGSLPINVKCLFEGEEESGSQSLADFLQRHASVAAADAVLMSDMTMPTSDQPAITYALRGTVSLELEVRAPGHELHSGLYGGAVPNAVEALCTMVARLHSPSGEVAIPGFYDRVRTWSREERTYMAEVGPTDEELLRHAQSSEGPGEAGYTLYERTTIRPSLSVNGVVGGYQDEGAMAVIPAHALAKLNFRLVPDQNPAEIIQLFRGYIIGVTPPAVTAEVRINAQAEPALVNRSHPAVQAARLACYSGFGAHPIFLRSGGTIPVVSLFQRILGAPVVLLGLALPDDAMHGPNERFYLPNFYRGIATSIYFLAHMGALRPGVKPSGMAGGLALPDSSNKPWPNTQESTELEFEITK